MGEPNPPHWPDSVKVFLPPTLDDKDNKVEEIKAILKCTEDSWNKEHGCYTSDHHFSKRRLALLFAPGDYKGIDVEIGYYVQILGLGAQPDQVRFLDCELGPHVPALNKHLPEHAGSLDTFWRSAENFSTFPKSGNMLWAVSQASPLRRVQVECDLKLFDQGFASGGFMANCHVKGKTDFGGQQQWLSRNCDFVGGVEGGAWSLAFVGCSGNIPAEHMGSDKHASISIESKTPVLVEKPYIAMKADMESFELRIPKVFRKDNEAGSCFENTKEQAHDFSHVFVAKAEEADVATKIQMALDDRKHVVLAPGIFALDNTLHIRHDNQVLLGIGLATLTGPSNGSPCITVSPKTHGVRIAGIMLEASKRIDAPGSSSLLEWGAADEKDEGDPANPGGLFDVFCRVGGDTDGDRPHYYIDCIMRIHSGNVIGDNIWIWRADHAKLMPGEKPNFEPIPAYHQTEEDEYHVRNGIHVTGNDVIIYGLAVEHTNEHQTVWSGERGQVFFYQCELPYDVSQASFGDMDYVGYFIDDHVENHKVVAPGVYSNFRNAKVVVKSAVKHPKRNTIYCANPFTVHLDNNGCIESVVNGRGDPAREQGIPSRVGSDI
ncbi:hypothetical protein MHU86_3357 [Fragilaria crotonensis]|nr:hypothetical protein MHU86_3357 [Fragilaria crotonensis]